MPFTRTTRIPQRAGPKRLTEWFGLTFQTDVIGLPAGSFLIAASLDTSELPKRPFTITRTIGQLFISSDQAAANEWPFGALGGIVVSDKAIATGATAVPDPVTQVASDEWFLYQPFAVAGAADAAFKKWEVFDFDSRGQRKVQDGEDVAMVIANSNATDGLFFVLSFRMLVKLS